MNDVVLLPGDSVTVRSSDGSALNYTGNPLHADSLSISVSGGGVIPPEPQGACSIAVFQPSTGQLAIRHTLTAGYADEMHPSPDPHGQPVTIGEQIWSFRDGVWTSPSGSQQQFGQPGDYGLGGQFGSTWGKCVCRAGAPYQDGTPSREFIFAPGAYVSKYMIGSGPAELAFAHCWGEGPTPWFIGQAYPGGLWLIRAPHGSDRRFEFDYQQGDSIVSALFDGTHPGIARVRAASWSIWFNLDSLNPNHPDATFQYGNAGDTPLAGQFA
jgi:hypothetical protein